MGGKRKSQTYIPRKRIEQELHKSEERQDVLTQMNTAILNALPAHISMVDNSGKILSVNKSWKRFARTNIFKGTNLGIGSNYIEVCERAHGDCAEEAQAVGKGLQAVLAGKQNAFALEYPCHAPNEERWFRVMITPISETENAGAVVMHLNIPERQQALAREQQFTATVLDTARALVVVLDPHWRILRVNRTCEELTGQKSEQLKGRFFLDLSVASGENSGAVRGLLKSFKSRQFPDTFENAWVGNDRKLLWVSWSNAVIHNERGQVEHIIATGVDITARKQAEEAILESQTRIEGIIRTAIDAIITIDNNQRIVVFNPAAEAMFGCSAEKAVGKSLDQFIPRRFRHAHRQYIREFGQSGATPRTMGRVGTVYGLRANGEEFPLEASISKVGVGKLKLFTVILRDITDRLEAEQALQRSEERLELAIKGANLGVWDWNIQAGEVHHDKQWVEMLGYTVDELEPTFENWEQRLHPQDKRSVLKTLQDHLDGLTPVYQTEHRLRTKTGKWKWILDTGKVVNRDLKGKPQRVTGTHQDITNRKETEQEFSRLWRQNELILDSAGEGIYGIDGNGKATFFNRAAEKLTGWKWKEINGQFLHSLLHHTKPNGTPYPWEECPVYSSLTHGTPHLVESEVLWHKDGTSFPVEYTSMPIRTEKKKIEGAVVTFRDITDRKKSEEALRESEERFQAFMNHSPAVAFLKNEKGQYVYVNQPFETLLNKSSNECLGKTDRHLFPPDVARTFREHDREAIKIGRVLEVEETTLDDRGAIRHWLVMKFPVRSIEGQLLLGGVALDITSRKQVEEALRQREAELLGSQEVLQTLGGQLISAQEDERRRISRELHDDMNQRLAVLALNIQAAQKEFAESAPMHQTLQRLYDGVSSLSDDVRHLAYQLHPSILDDLGLEVALQSFLNDFSKWEGIPVTFTSTDMTEPLPQEIASCLYRVTQECLRNVARHAQATQVEVKLIGGDRGLRLSIKDNGKGFKVEKKRPDKPGLGLIGMQERVRVVQGTYDVKSEPDQGTEITIWVPCSKEKK